MVTEYSESPITRHVKLRGSQRYNYIINKKARRELVKIIQNYKCEIIKYEKITCAHKRLKLLVPVFLSKEMCELNPHIKFGDWIPMVYDLKYKRLITILPIEDTAS